MWLVRPPGVYRPQGDTDLLTEALRLAGVRAGCTVLDVGCGTGALSVYAARLSPRSVMAVDVSRRAVWATRVNAVARGLDVRVMRQDGMAIDRAFDVVLANPPYVPGNADLPTRGR
jgi:release factor glutamine methyltransferase